MNAAAENISADDLPTQEEVEMLPPAETIVEFHVLNATGEIVREGSCVESMLSQQAFFEGEVVVEGQAPEPQSSEVLSTHSIARQQAYPSVNEQLDAIWKILGRNPAALGEEGLQMLERIQGVKQSFPKDVIYVMNNQRTCEDDPAFIPLETQEK